MSNISLSVIIPVYNVEKYLKKCLDSVLDQDINDYEIIVVNDGSKDKSQSIIDEYKNKYPSLINAFIKQNGGLSSARNYGAKQAHGKYICFIDSDDYVEKNHYKKMLDLAIKEDSDLVVTDFEYVWENNPSKSLYKKGIETGNNDYKKALFLSPLFSWNKMYRKELFDKLECKYPEGLWYEDIPVTLRYAAHCNKISYLNELGFHYLQRESSIMGTSYSEKMNDIFTIYQILYDSFKKDNLFDEYKEEMEYSFVEALLIYGAFRFLRTDHYKELMSKSFDFVKEHFPDYQNNKYLYKLGYKNRFFLKTHNIKTMSIWKKLIGKRK